MKALGHNVRSYHAEMDEAARKQIQEDWFDDRITAIVATVAFGMCDSLPDALPSGTCSMKKSPDPHDSLVTSFGGVLCSFF